MNRPLSFRLLHESHSCLPNPHRPALWTLETTSVIIDDLTSYASPPIIQANDDETLIEFCIALHDRLLTLPIVFLGAMPGADFPRIFQLKQLSHRNTANTRGDISTLSRYINLLRPAVGEAFDHHSTIMCNVINVNRYVLGRILTTAPIRWPVVIVVTGAFSALPDRLLSSPRPIEQRNHVPQPR